MTHILEDFWHGNLFPAEMPLKDNKKCLKLAKLLTENENKLSEVLNETGKELFEKHKEYSDKISALTEKDIFINGFSLGVRMMIDVFCKEEI